MINRSTSRVSVWEPAAPTPEFVVEQKPVAISNEREILGVLEGPLPLEETVALAYHRVETELGRLFAQLSLIEARALHRRLSIPAADDAIATRFGRMVPERRLRLIAFLADAPRRAALSGRR